MENLFYYSTKESEGSQRVVEYLMRLEFMGRVVVLPAGSEFTSVHCLKMRSNDPFVLFAADAGELAALETLSNELKVFQVMLVLGGGQDACTRNLLTNLPRMVFLLERDLEALGKALRALFVLHNRQSNRLAGGAE